MPFGEELYEWRTGYGGSSVRQKFTGYERDQETGLDYAQARYYAGASGRFMSPDPTLLSVNGFNPQSWNRYTYVTNNPENFIDPFGLWTVTWSVTYAKNPDGTDNTSKAISAQAYLVQEKGDDAASLADALNVSQKDAEKIFNKMKDGAIRGKDAGGRIGEVFEKIEGYIKEWVNDALKYGVSGNTNWRRGNDCSSTSADIGLGRSESGTPTVDASLRQFASALNDENQLRTGDIVRYAKDGPVAEHFAVFLFFNRDGVPVVFSKSGMRGNFEFDTVPNIGSNYNYGTVKPLPGAPGRTGYYRRQF